MKEKWIEDFSGKDNSCFDIKPEIAYHACLQKGSLPPGSGISPKKSALFFGLKKKNFLAWLETEECVYTDQLVEAHFGLDSSGGYCAAGLMFRMDKQGSYYLALVSSKGYFRLDAVNNNVSRSLTGWIEAPVNAENIRLGIIARADHLIFTLDGKWTAEIYDHTIPGGSLGFALASYCDSEPGEIEDTIMKDGYTCSAWLYSLSLDSSAQAVETEYQKWSSGAEISLKSRMLLAGNLAALGRPGAAYEQILRAWEHRKEAARSVTATYSEMRTKDELLFAAQITLALGEFETAEKYIDLCLEMCTTNGKSAAVETAALAEKAKILCSAGKFGDLAAFLPGYIAKTKAAGECTELPAQYALLGYAHQKLLNYRESAVAWDKALSLDKKNCLYAANAAKARKQSGRTKKPAAKKQAAETAQ